MMWNSISKIKAKPRRLKLLEFSRIVHPIIHSFTTKQPNNTFINVCWAKGTWHAPVISKGSVSGI